jgi:hypothetical protein
MTEVDVDVEGEAKIEIEVDAVADVDDRADGVKRRESIHRPPAFPLRNVIVSVWGPVDKDGPELYISC